MNAAQKRLLRWLESQWAKHRRAHGLAADRAARLAMYRRATGREVSSSKALRGDDLTTIKRHILGLIEPNNLAAQLKSQDDNDPELIRAALLHRCMEGAAVLKPDHELDCPKGCEDDRRTSYLANWSAKLGKDFRLMNNIELRKFVGVVEAKAAARRKRNEAEAREAAMRNGEDNYPF